MLSHPGFKSEDGAKKAPKCKQMKNMVPAVCGTGRSGKRLATVAGCVCYAVVRGLVTVAAKRLVLMKCRMLFGNTRKIRSLGFACNSFRSKNGMLNRRMIMRNLSVLDRCLKNKS